MTLYYSLVFALLTFEIGTFLVLVAPMPFTVKQKFMKFLATNPYVAKLQYSLKISLIFTGILFFDAVQRMLRVVQEGQAAKSGQAVQDVRSETTFAARKFYAQRNVYLTGFTLFLSLILSRVFSIILDLIQTQEELQAVKKGGSASEDVTTLKSRLESKDREIANLIRQGKANNAVLDDLADSQNAAQGGSKKTN